jgi:hypothetical protein
VEPFQEEQKVWPSYLFIFYDRDDFDVVLQALQTRLDLYNFELALASSPVLF